MIALVYTMFAIIALLNRLCCGGVVRCINVRSWGMKSEETLELRAAQKEAKRAEIGRASCRERV